MHASLQSIRARPPALGWLFLGRIRRIDWDTTPGKLRAALIVLVLGVLLAGGAGVYAAIALSETTDDIAGQLEPLNANVTTLYRSLADADATVAAGYLAGGVEPATVRATYDEDIRQAAAGLARAGAPASGDLVTASRIADITAQLPVYTGLVERARANNREGRAVGVAYLRRASGLMQSSILPQAEELQRRQAQRLDEAYARAWRVPVIALAVCAVTLAGLIWAQLFVFRCTRRVFNVGLVAASGAVLAGLVWWTVVGVAASGSLTSSHGHSRSVSAALGPAQIAARQARAVESLELVTRNGDVAESDFDAQDQLLERNGGAGGALGAAKQIATDSEGRALVQTAIGAANRYVGAHRQVRRLDAAGRYTDAIGAAVNEPSAFAGLVTALDRAVGHERSAFGSDIGHAQRWLRGLPVGTGVLALVAAAGVVLGVQRRLEEYR